MARPEPKFKESFTSSQHQTRILKASVSNIGSFKFSDPARRFLAPWSLDLNPASQDAQNLQQAATAIRNTNVPVAFPTETVYGLGASALASRSEAVKAIFAVKGRPADNPLIVHISSLAQLSHLLRTRPSDDNNPKTEDYNSESPLSFIPPIYHPLISRFWPGPLTILLPLPPPSPLAPEVTGSHKLTTFGARMPSSLLALALIHLADTPLAAPSANASMRPSPTTAEHVMHDLQGKIDIILDGGACEIGVESTVVDGLSDPPAVLRPGGVSLEILRECEGWSGVVKGYQDKQEITSQGNDEQKGVVNGNREEEGPRAPGMKYKHYSPRAKVVLVRGMINASIVHKYTERKDDEEGRGGQKIGFITTRNWRGSQLTELLGNSARLCPLGSDTSEIARGLFSALRAMDEANVGVIFVEGIDDSQSGEAAAVMNRLRKAAEVQVEC